MNERKPPPLPPKPNYRCSSTANSFHKNTGRRSPLPPVPVKPENDLTEFNVSSVEFPRYDNLLNQISIPLESKANVKPTRSKFENIDQKTLVSKPIANVSVTKRNLEEKLKSLKPCVGPRPEGGMPVLNYVILEKPTVTSQSTILKPVVRESVKYETIRHNTNDTKTSAGIKENLQGLTLLNKEIEALDVRKELELVDKIKAVATVKPTQRIEVHSSISPKPQTSQTSPELAFLIKDLKEGELKYISKLSAALEIEAQLTEESVPQLGYKFFSLLDQIHAFHKSTFIKDLEDKSATPKNFVLCFVTHHLRFKLYIQRQWQTPQEAELDSFEYYLYKKYNLEPYLGLTVQRVADYGENLKLLKAVCEKDKNTECRVAVDEALKVIANLQHQIDKVNFLKEAFGNFSDKLSHCGPVILEGAFSISKNGGKSSKCIVYFCENLIFFASPQSNGHCHYIDSVATSDSYCRPMVKSKQKFEIGLRGRKNFLLVAESNEVKYIWCKQLKRTIKDDLYGD